MGSKRFLITQNALRSISGSEVVTYELATYLQASGADVTVYTFYLADPMKKHFVKSNLTVVDDEDTELSLGDFDYVWSHHQLLPTSMIRQLKDASPRALPRFIFHHMSAQHSNPLEHPHIWNLEGLLSSASLFVSPEAQTALSEYFPTKPPMALFQNPAPVAFSKLTGSHNALEKILIVSNHPPKEVADAKQRLRNLGYTVASLGEKQDKTDLIRPKDIADADLVVTIGKTVQYCLVAGVPVYVYDHFGGPGYLNDANYTDAAEANFSGRRFQQKTAAAIADEVVKGWQDARCWQRGRRKAFIEQFTIDRALKKLLTNLPPRPSFDSISSTYLHYLIDAHKLTRDLVVCLNQSALLNQEIDELRGMNHDVTIAAREAVERVTHEFRASTSYRIGHAITAPYRILTRRV